jgi:hypothetical protein
MGDAVGERMGELRAKILTESLEISNCPKFGYFGFPGPLCIGDDSYAPRLMKKAPAADANDSEPITNIKTSTTKKGMHPSVFFSFEPPLCVGDPYVDPSAREIAKNRVKMLDPDQPFRPAGKIKIGGNKLGYEYVPHMDGVKDPKAVKEALQDVLPLRQIYSNPTKKGGGGVLTGGVLFGWGEERKFPEHVPDDYDSAKKLRKEELAEHMKLTQENPFKSGAYGNNNFSSNNETFGCDVPTHVPRDPVPDKTKAYPHECEFRPAAPMKKGMLKGLLGGFPEHMPDPVREGFLMKKAKVEDAPPAFRIGAPITTQKPTPSVTTLTRNMRNERPASFARPLL